MELAVAIAALCFVSTTVNIDQARAAQEICQKYYAQCMLNAKAVALSERSLLACVVEKDFKKK